MNEERPKGRTARSPLLIVVTDPVNLGQGGSIPFIATFAEAFPDAKIVVTGVEDPATQAHSVNESLDLGVLERAATAEALLLARLS